MSTAVHIVYSRSRTIGSVLIRAGAWWGPWSHCGIVHNGFVIEALALKGGVVATPWDAFERRASEWTLEGFDVPDADAGHRWAWSTIGSPYDWSGLLGIPLRVRDWQQPGRWYCSEHAEAFLHHAGLRRWRHGMHGISPCQSYFNAST
jgi:hypothetical protein